MASEPGLFLHRLDSEGCARCFLLLAEELKLPLELLLGLLLKRSEFLQRGFTSGLRLRETRLLSFEQRRRLSPLCLLSLNEGIKLLP